MNNAIEPNDNTTAEQNVKAGGNNILHVPTYDPFLVIAHN